MEDLKQIESIIKGIYSCNSLYEHFFYYGMNRDLLKNGLIIVFSEDGDTELPKPMHTNYESKYSVVNLGCANRFYAINEKIYQEMKEKGKSDFKIDTSVELDTQVVSHLKDVFINYDKVVIQNDKIELLEYLFLDDVNYSAMPYLLENGAKKYEINKYECYKNLVSYELLRAFKYKDYKKTGNITYDKTESEIRILADSNYNYIFSDNSYKNISKYLIMKKGIYALLLKAICIEFESSKKSANNKMKMLFDFVNQELGVLMQREIEICYLYFNHDGRTTRFFKRIQKNNLNILNDINGMAWDLSHLRTLPMLINLSIVPEASFAVPVFLTHDNGLKDISQINPIEQIVFVNGNTYTKFKHQISEIVANSEAIISQEARELRRNTFGRHNIDEIIKSLENEIVNYLNI